MCVSKAGLRGLSFNVSHHGRWVALAGESGFSVGMRPRPLSLSLSRSVKHHAMFARFNGAPCLFLLLAATDTASAAAAGCY